MDRRRLLTQTTELDSGIVVEETYRLNGRLHRPCNEGPAVIERSTENGGISRELYYRHGRRHRLNGPARIDYVLAGPIVCLEMHYRNGRIHRDPNEGPAWTERDGRGKLREESYWVNDHPYDAPERPLAKASKAARKKPAP
jgi:hypothetical protein